MSAAAPRAGRAPGPRAAAAGMAAVWVLLFACACRLDAGGAFAVDPGETVTRRLLGSARSALAGRCYLAADRYFHRGAGHVETLAFRDGMRRLLDRLVPQAHEHAAGADALEIMPWLRFATEMDPHHVEAYLVAAFWAESAGQPDGLVEAVFREARAANPVDYRLPMAWGRFAARRGLPNAAKRLETAMRLWPRGEEDPRQAGLDRAMMDEWLACLYGSEGRGAEALERVADALRHHPRPGGLAELARSAETLDAEGWRARRARLGAHVTGPAYPGAPGGCGEDDHGEDTARDAPRSG